MNEMHPLGKLIQASQDRNGWSTRDLQRMAGMRGFNMTHSNFSRLKNDEIVSIKGSIIKLLAEVLGLPETKVARAAMASMGVDLQIDEVAVDAAVRNSNEFSERDRRIITSVLDAMRDTQGEATNDNQDKPETNPPGERTLRAVGSGREAVAGQKIDPEDPEYLKPLPLEQMAAHPNFTLHRDKFDEAYGDAGEENQDPDGE